MISLLALPLWLGAKSVAEIDPALQDRYYGLLGELRCLVCQNQSLADSDAGLAQDLRDEVVKLLEQGASDREVLDFMHSRYGDFVLYKPLVQPKTYLLWYGPFVLLGGGALLMILMLRRRKTVSDTPLSEAEQEQLKQLLDESQDAQTKDNDT